MILSQLERYQLSNQLRILEALYPDEASELAKHREVFESGYEMLYDDAMQHIYQGDDVLTIEECQEVWETMDMFDAIDRSIEELGKEHTPYVTKFKGYDGNSEGKYMSFAEFTVKKDHRFTYLPLEQENYFNSHGQVRDSYLRMLEVWRTIPTDKRFPMSEDTLEELLDARIHPTMRGQEQ